MGFALLGAGAPLLLAVAFLGLGQAGVFPLALMLLTLRGQDAATAQALSTMAQGLGFVSASVGGLVLVSFLHAWNGSWTALWIGLAVVAVLQAVAGCAAASHSLIAMPPADG